jgi:hypothetical protein
MSITTTLPEYVSLRNLGAESILPPGRFTGVITYMFALQGDINRMQALAERFLSAPTGGEIEVEVLSSTLLMMFNNVEKLSSPDDVMGWIPDCECALVMPVMMKKKGLLHPWRFELWMPYIFIDNARGMATGRESWGYPKELAQMTIPANPAEAVHFSVDTLVFTTFSSDTKGEVLPLIQVDQVDQSGSHSELQGEWKDLQGLCKWMFKTLAHGAADIELLADLVKMWSESEVPVVNLKQFRHTADGTRACYQSLVSGPLKFTTVRRGGLLTSNYKVSIIPCDSHDIIGTFGLATDEQGRVDVQFGAWIDYDFDAMPGEVLWTAGIPSAATGTLTIEQPGMLTPQGSSESAPVPRR